MSRWACRPAYADHDERDRTVLDDGPRSRQVPVWLLRGNAPPAHGASRSWYGVLLDLDVRRGRARRDGRADLFVAERSDPEEALPTPGAGAVGRRADVRARPALDLGPASS